MEQLETSAKIATILTCMLVKNGPLIVNEAREECLKKGFTTEIFNECLSSYQRLNIWLVDNGKITFQ